MGNTESNERQLFIGVILQLLSKRGIKVKKSTIQSFFSFVQEQCPWFPQEGTVNLDIWERVGKQLKIYHAEHGSEKVPNDAFPLWNIIRDALDPAPESEKVHFKEESEEKTVVKPEEDEEDPPDYRQLRKMLAVMITQEQIKDRDEKQDQLSPQNKEDLDEITARYHSDEDWSLLNKDAPKSLRETSPIRPCAPKSLRETSPIRPSAPRSLREMSPIRSYAPRNSQDTFPVNPFVTSEYQTVQRAPEYRAEDMEPMPLPPPPIPSRAGPIPKDMKCRPQDITPITLPPPPYRSGSAPLSIPRRQRRVFSAPGDKFDPQLQACFPLIFGNDEDEQKALCWEPVSFQLVKKLKNACVSYGPKAPYRMQLVENLAGQWLTPREWKTIARACLSGGHFILWKSEYDDLARMCALSNQVGELQYITETMLLGQVDYPSLNEQMKLDKTAVGQVADCAFTAWRSLPDGNASGTALSNIKQKSEEPFEDFVSRLSEAVQRIISDSEAAKLLTKQLAFENANSTCQAILRPIRRSGTLIDYIKQCADVGPSMLQGVAIAAAMKGNSYQQAVQSFFTNKNKPTQCGPNNQNRNALPRTCFSCAQVGHISRACPQRPPSSYPPNPAQPVVSAPQNPAPQTAYPRSLCPRCQKGYHWVRDCRSRFHRNGAFLAPDWQSGNGLRGQPQALTTIGAASLNPFIPFVPSQNSSEQPQVAQDWISVPPPQQY